MGIGMVGEVKGAVKRTLLYEGYMSLTVIHISHMAKPFISKYKTGERGREMKKQKRGKYYIQVEFLLLFQFMSFRLFFLRHHRRRRRHLLILLGKTNHKVKQKNLRYN